jgi:hypothetical protein
VVVDGEHVELVLAATSIRCQSTLLCPLAGVEQAGSVGKVGHTMTMP